MAQHCFNKLILYDQNSGTFVADIDYSQLLIFQSSSQTICQRELSGPKKITLRYQ